MKILIKIDQLSKPRIKDPDLRQKALELHNKRAEEMKSKGYLEFIEENVNFGIMSQNEYKDLISNCEKIWNLQ